jgi:hypothetical protein
MLLFLSPKPRLPDFSWHILPKWGKYTKLPLKYQNVPNGHNLHQIYIEYTYLFHSKPSKIYPHWSFLFENIPSGNPVPNLPLSAGQIKERTDSGFCFMQSGTPKQPSIFCM